MNFHKIIRQWPLGPIYRAHRRFIGPPTLILDIQVHSLKFIIGSRQIHHISWLFCENSLSARLSPILPLKKATRPIRVFPEPRNGWCENNHDTMAKRLADLKILWYHLASTYLLHGCVGVTARKGGTLCP